VTHTNLKAHLDALVVDTDPQARLAADPLRFARAWARADDAEVAAVFASGLAFGRVAAFGPVVKTLMDRAALHGGPRRWIETFGAEEAAWVAPLVYRWMRGRDFALLAFALQEVLQEHGRLGALAESAGVDAACTGAAQALGAVVEPLRAAAVKAAPRVGLSVGDYGDLPRGLRYLLPHPRSGSACKRWCMFLRWMVRKPGPGAAGVDLGLWDLPSTALVIPLDTHVHRIARYLGLTTRTDASWRTAVDVTRSLAALDPADPVRYDFALAHLGISGACRGEHVPEICGRCALHAVCTVVQADA
jgi:uncharacterized protein (TIGR02757 family)